MKKSAEESLWPNSFKAVILKLRALQIRFGAVRMWATVGAPKA